MKKLFAIALCLSLFATAALADTVSFNGTVTSKETCEVYAPIGGTVDQVYFTAGETVTADSILATLKTDKVYATEDGTVTGVFGEPGSSAETVATRYGAVLYIEGSVKYTISASTDYAYNSTETQYVHTGESVYLKGRSNASHTGAGLVTAVSGTGFTVEVTEGSFLIDESVEVFRGNNYAAATRIGRGDIARKNPTAVTGTGSIVSFAVKDGDTVKRGDLLFETLNGTFDGYYMSGTELYAGFNGVLSSVSLSKGAAVQKSSTIAVIYPEGAMRIEGSIAESNLAYVHVGQKVEIELNWNQDEDVTYAGQITAISALGTAGQDGSVTYTVYIDFTPDADTRYGMSAVITTVEDEKAPVITEDNNEVTD